MSDQVSLADMRDWTSPASKLISVKCHKPTFSQGRGLPGAPYPALCFCTSAGCEIRMSAQVTRPASVIES
jgi:hypothetical protein